MLGKASALALLLLGLVSGAAAAAPGITEVPFEGGGSEGGEGPGVLAAGPAGEMWFVASSEELGRIDPDGTVSKLALSARVSGDEIAAAPDGTLWIAGRGRAHRVGSNGAVTSLPLRDGEERPRELLVAANGDLWFADFDPVPARGLEGPRGPAAIVRMTPQGQLRRFPVPGDPDHRRLPICALAAGQDGSIWFSDPSFGRVGRISPRGTIDEYQLSTTPCGITPGAGGAIWVAAQGKIDRIGEGGTVTEFPLEGGSATEIASGGDGNLWFASYRSTLGRMTPAGEVTRIPAARSAGYAGLFAASDGAVWATTENSPIKGVLARPVSRIVPGVPGVDIGSTSTAADGGASVGLSCSGSPRAGCRGTITLRLRGKVTVAADYSIAPESSSEVALRLPANAARRLERDRFFLLNARAEVDGGYEARRQLVLRRDDPLVGLPRPGQVLQMALPPSYEGFEIARGADGAFWLSGATGSLTRVSPTGEARLFPLPGLEREAEAIVRGPRRSVWFLVASSAYFAQRTLPLIGRMAPDGTYSELPLPPGPPPSDLAAGAGGELWVVRASGVNRRGRIERVAVGGGVTRYRIGGAYLVAAGPSGTAWFAAYGKRENRIGRIGPGRRVRSWPIPHGGLINDLAIGPDGNAWFTHQYRRHLPPAIGRITPSGGIAEFPIHPRGRHGEPGLLARGPQRTLWMSESEPGRIDRVKMNGELVKTRLPKQRAASDLAFGPRGTIWFPDSPDEITELGIFAPRSLRPDAGR